MSANDKVAEIITERIIEDMQKTGIPAWRKPWTVRGFRNLVSKKHYQGVNVLMLSLFGHSDWYLTPKQIFANGGTIKKGSKTIPIVFWKVQKEERDSSNHVTKRGYWLLRYYNVLPIEATEGVKLKIPSEGKIEFTPIESAEKLVAASWGSNRTRGGCRGLLSQHA